MPHARTVGELRKFLDELEAQWTDEDNQMLGKLEDQPVRVPYFKNGKCMGYGPATIAYDPTGLGLLIDEPAHHTMQIPPVVASFSYSDPDGIVNATTDAPIKAVQVMDDGALHVVLDHWPR